MNTPLRRSGMARILNGSHSFTCTPRVYQLTEWTIPVFAFSAGAGTHLPTPEERKAELALGGWFHTTCLWYILEFDIQQYQNITNVHSLLLTGQKICVKFKIVVHMFWD